MFGGEQGNETTGVGVAEVVVCAGEVAVNGAWIGHEGDIFALEWCEIDRSKYF